MEIERLVDELHALPGIEAVALGGSRARGAERPDSDWDLAIYYRGAFDPESLRALGHPGRIFPLGGWGGGVFNGGAAIEVDGVRVDVHYRDPDSIDAELAAARAGRVRTEALMFHLAGIPGYIVLAELALCRVLRGDLPRPEYPDALADAASELWTTNAGELFFYARGGHAARGRAAQCVAMTVQAATYAAHGILATRRVWLTNEKGMLEAAGLEGLDGLVLGIRSADPAELVAFVDAVEALCAGVLENARGASAT